MALCVPSLMPSLTHLKNWKDGLKVGIKFNLPRICLLTVFGGILGGLIYSASNSNLVSTVGSFSFQFGYIVIGISLTGLGIYSLANSLEEREDLKEESCHPLFKFVKKDEFPTLWGGLFSLVCVGEAALAFESFILTGSLIQSYSSVGLAIVFGALVMFTFGIGLAIPTILFSSVSSDLAKNKSKKVLNKVRMVSSVMMISLGLIVILQGVLI